MPELPEVETTRIGITPYIKKQRVNNVVIRQTSLRWPVPHNLRQKLKDQTINDIQRRAKYLLFATQAGHLIIHLGMSGSLRMVNNQVAPNKHDHIDVVFNKKTLRFHDPRRFGAVLWTNKNPLEHKLLKNLGPEPLSDEFTGEHLHQLAQAKKVNVKNFIMNSHIVAGVGNIYASESLFLSGIHPQRAAGRISLARYEILAENIKQILTHAIELGGTTLRNFVREDGKPGYFSNKLNVYNQTGKPCPVCKNPIKVRIIGQRSSFFCVQCQH
ncbi:MAG: bifunctional DNA-formamidopyrimidine glycosylase/DNA-(apurinic or apyrimidinic site) lyase [Nitrosomonadaceae bacterium]|nr:bifunctional DNA-formamidopyrimidine glycosylase/DNA-(apurinic or apyrimidinic site) lyase [Nitrosomonadaceae bacterium]